MSVDDEIRILGETIGIQQARGDAFRAMTTASRHMRAAMGFLEPVQDERAHRAVKHLLDAIGELASIEVPK